MPQMSPLWWTFLFFCFLTLFLLMNIMNYFSFQPSPSSKSKLFNQTSMIWKW